MIYILEGPDGTGKSTLANKIAEIKKASVIHSHFNKEWDIKKHHEDMFKAALTISKWMPVVLDRWALSELVYGTVFRQKPGYDVLDYLWMRKPELDQEEIVWIYCHNDKVVENHLKNKENRNEMFDDMTEVAKMFDDFIKNDAERDWISYDFTKNKRIPFVKELPGENFVN